MWQQIKNFYHLAQALVAVLFFNFPAKRLITIGVTGTDGKTTTSAMIAHILKRAGYKVALINSLGVQNGSRIFETGDYVTTPSAFGIQRFLKKAVTAKVKFAVIEATSHGLDQNRLAFINFRVAVVTNIAHEHLDYHKTYPNYLKSKSKLFKNANFSILNLDDTSYDYLKNHAAGKILAYSISHQGDFNPEKFPIKLKILGSFNLENALAAASAATALGIEKRTIINALESFKQVKGRMQKIDLGQDFDVYVDFAHTPNAFAKVLQDLKKIAAEKRGRLIILFGAAGERDMSKRSKMGQIAAKFADYSIITAEDPRSEKIEEICLQIAKGFKNHQKKFTIIYDRQKAIKYALNITQKGTVVAFLGKGHERSMAYNDKIYPWNEIQIISRAIKERMKRKK